MTKKFTGKQIGIAGGILAALIALLIGISIYNTPANRLARLLDLGHRYLDEENYEQAALTFDKAIAIDGRCMEAYAGSIQSYQGLGDEEGLVDIYERALDVTSGLGESELTESMDTVVEIYLAADDVYSDSPEKTVQVLEAGLKITEDERIEDMLIEDYLKLAKDYIEQGDYEKALEIYDRLLELDEENAEVLQDLENCLREYIDLLIGQERYDEIEGLVKKYQDEVNTEDMQPFSDNAEEQAETGENSSWIDDLYRKMISGDIEAVYAILLEPDFIEKYSGYEHKQVNECMEYKLLTSEEKTIVIMEYDDSICALYCVHEDEPRIWLCPDTISGGDYFYQYYYMYNERSWLIGNNYYFDALGEGGEVSYGESVFVYNIDNWSE